MNLNFDSHNHRCVADALGLGSLADGEPGMDPDLLRRLYRHAQGDDGPRNLFENDPSFRSGWVNLESSNARELISAFVPLDDADNLKEARRSAQANLEAQAWNDLLGIDTPPIECKVKIHGAKWGYRFQSAEPAMRGHELLNEALPRIPADVCGSQAESPAGSEEPTSPESTCGMPSVRNGDLTETITAEDVLRRAGLPT